MNRPAETTRREWITGSAAALAGTSLLRPAPAQAAEPVKKDAPWHERRAQVERAWLDLLGDFPTTIPALAPEMRKVTLEPGCPSERLTAQQLAVLKQQMAEEKGGIERFHVSFQTEADDRVTGWRPRAAPRR